MNQSPYPIHELVMKLHHLQAETPDAVAVAVLQATIDTLNSLARLRRVDYEAVHARFAEVA